MLMADIDMFLYTAVKGKMFICFPQGQIQVKLLLRMTAVIDYVVTSIIDEHRLIWKQILFVYIKNE